jgi:hypothetical protein
MGEVRSRINQENTMKFGKLVSRVVTHTLPVTRQRPGDNFAPMQPFASLHYGEKAQLGVAQALSLRDQAATWVGYVCPGRAQDQSNQGTGGVYEIDHETYQPRNLA